MALEQVGGSHISMVQHQIQSNGRYHTMTNADIDSIKQQKMDVIRQRSLASLDELVVKEHIPVRNFLISLSTTQQGRELARNLSDYIRLTGWTQKRFFLTGAAHMISLNDDNPELIMQIASYLSTARPAGRPIKKDDH